MSYKHLNAAYEESNCAGLTKFVLVYLAGAANEHGICWPSVSCIGEKCGISETTVHKAIRELVEFGELRIYEKGGPIAGKNISNHYEVVVRHAHQGGTPDAPGVVRHAHPNHNIESPLNIPPIVPQGGNSSSLAGAKKKKLSIEQILSEVSIELFLRNNSLFMAKFRDWAENKLRRFGTGVTIRAFELDLANLSRYENPEAACEAIDFATQACLRAIPKPKPKTPEQRKREKWGMLA